LLIHLWQEGRGIGLADKMRAYARQINDGADTVDANILVGRGVDERTYDDVALILGELEIPAVRLLTNNPAKLDALRSLGVQITEVTLVPPRVNPLNRNYVRTKAVRMNHAIDLSTIDAVSIADRMPDR
jgi:GTP cyclohydrolase II